MNLAPPLCKFDTTPIMLYAEYLFAHGIQEVFCPFDEKLLYDEGIIINGFVSISSVVAEIDFAAISITSCSVDRVLTLSDPYSFLQKPEHVWPKIFRTRKSHEYIWCPVPCFDVMRYPGVQFGTFGPPKRVRSSYSFTVKNEFTYEGRVAAFELFFELVQ